MGHDAADSKGGQQRTAMKSSEMTAPTIMYFFMLAIFFSSCSTHIKNKTVGSTGNKTTNNGVHDAIRPTPIRGFLPRL